MNGTAFPYTVGTLDDASDELRNAIKKISKAAQGSAPDVAVSALLSVFASTFTHLATDGGYDQDVTAQDLVDDFRDLLPGVEAALRQQYGMTLAYAESRRSKP